MPGTLTVQTQQCCVEKRMGSGYTSVVKDAAKLRSLIMPLLVICGLLLLWVLIVVICLYMGQGLDSHLGGTILLH